VRTRLRLVATAAKGTEDLCAAELRGLGMHSVRPLRGAVEFDGDLVAGLKACLHLRTALRVLLPLGKVPATDPDTLYQGLQEIAWEDHLGLRQTFAIEVAGTTPGLTHSLFVAQRAKDAIVDRLRPKLGGRPNVDTRDPDLRIGLHLSRGQADVSLDLAGDSLHRRGYRQRPHPASLKETLAAAILLACGYEGETPLLDPLCGAGTLAIEAALIAARRAPNESRKFGAERWPTFDASARAALADLRAEARAQVRAPPAPIHASDRDPDAVAAAIANVRGVKLPIRVTEADARTIAPMVPPGLVVANPPYGGRIGGGGGRKQLKTFYHQLGANFRGFGGHQLAFLAGSPDFESAFGLKPFARRKLFNGPIECQLLHYRIRG